jgi:mannose-1-phosphate guanylyltransferase
MFIWRTDVILEEIRNLMPDLYEGLEKIKKQLNSDKYGDTLFKSLWTAKKYLY